MFLARELRNFPKSKKDYHRLYGGVKEYVAGYNQALTDRDWETKNQHI